VDRGALSALSVIDAATGNQRCCFTPASVKRGSFAGTQAFGLGSNQLKMQRSSLWL
jgi:hypothetical protein